MLQPSDILCISIGEGQIAVGEQTYTLDEAVEHIGFGLYHVKVIIIAGLSWVSKRFCESTVKRYILYYRDIDCLCFYTQKYKARCR